MPFLCDGFENVWECVRDALSSLSCVYILVDGMGGDHLDGPSMAGIIAHVGQGFPLHLDGGVYGLGCWLYLSLAEESSSSSSSSSSAKKKAKIDGDGEAGTRGAP